MTNTNNMTAAELYAYHSQRGAELVESGYGWKQLMDDVESANSTMYATQVRAIFAKSSLSAL